METQVCIHGYFTEPHKYQLRVYLFQGRDLLPADPDGLSGECNVARMIQWQNAWMLIISRSSLGR